MTPNPLQVPALAGSCHGTDRIVIIIIVYNKCNNIIIYTIYVLRNDHVPRAVILCTQYNMHPGYACCVRRLRGNAILLDYYNNNIKAVEKLHVNGKVVNLSLFFRVQNCD